MENRVLIIGAGLAGSIAFHALRSFNPVIVEAQEQPKDNVVGLHPAVMRLRDSKVAEVIGAEYEEVKVSKGIFLDGRLLQSSNIRANNLYSMKVYGALGRRSLNTVGEVKRYLLPYGYKAPSNTLWGLRFKGAQDGVASFSGRSAVDEEIPYNWLVSTLPMIDMVNNYIGEPEGGFRTPIKFGHNPVYVLRMKTKIPSTIHQTIYFPNPETNIYRVTIQNQWIIIEAVEKEHYSDFEEMIETAFGIPDLFGRGVTSNGWEQMRIGKIIPIDENERLRYIMWLTDRHKIISFGRFSVWRPLRTDQLLDDAEKIRRLVSASGIKAQYRSRM